MKKPLIGFIGQGYIGKNYADDFERRNYKVVRYSLEPDYKANKNRIAGCDIVFIAVPTPTTPKGFDSSFLTQVLPLVGKGKIAVIKSTIIPGLAKSLQKKFSKITILHSPEFLSEATAAKEASSPFSNIVGMPLKDKKHLEAAKSVMKILPQAPFSAICSSDESEIIKYAHNCSGYMQIIFFNLLYDLAKKFGADWPAIQKAIENDPLIPNRYANPVHKGGRGAGGGCFIKDFAAFAGVYRKVLPKDSEAVKLLSAAEEKNIKLLQSTGKSLDLLRGVYGEKIFRNKK